MGAISDPKRESGISILGDVPWGTHFCSFYHTKQDLIDILVPYFKTGLENNEFCMWVVSEPLAVEEARGELQRAVMDLDQYNRKGQIEILDFGQWYTRTGKFDVDKVLRGWVDKEQEARKNGFEGLRISGSPLWTEQEERKSFSDYEATANNVIQNYHMLAICSYSLGKCDTQEILDVFSTHQFALIVRDGKWVTIESTARRRAEEALRDSEERYRSLFKNMLNGYAFCRILVDEENKPVDFIYIEVNDAFETLTGLRKEDVIGKRVSEAMPSITELNPEIIAVYGRVASTGVPTAFEAFLKPLGMWLSISVYSPHKDYFVAVFDNVTERKRAEERLLESEDRYRDLVEHSNDLICTHDLKGRLLSVNQASAILLGYSPDEILRMPLRELLVPEVRDQFEAYLETLGREGSARGLMVVQTRASERRIWKYSSTLRTKGVPAPIVRGMARDVTERVHAQKALRESQRRLELIARASNTGLWDWDLRTNLVYYSPEWKSQIGYAGHEISNRFEEWEARVHPEDLPGAIGRVRDYLADPQGEFESEFRFRHKDGSYRWILARGSVLKDDHGKPYRMLGPHLDITERKRAEEASRESEERYRTLFENSPVGIYRTTADGRILAGNPAFARMLGYSSCEELASRNLNAPDFEPQYSRGQFTEKLEKEGRITGLESEWHRRDGSVIFVRENARAIQDEAGQILYYEGTAEDITERKRTEESLRVSHRFLEIADRNTEMTHLLEEFVAEVRNFTGCVAVGLRMLDAEGKIPYQAYEGFDQRFYELESPLSIGSDQCMCVNVIERMTDPKLPFYTESGSFYMNGTTRFLATVSEEEKGRTRNVCNQFGYESVALVPIRSGDNMLGLIHVADYQANMVPLEKVQVLEGAAIQLGTAIQRVRAGATLRESEERFRGLVENATVGIYRTTPDGRILMANPALVRMLGFDSSEELAARNLECEGFAPGYPRSVFRERIEREGQVIALEGAWVRRDGSSIVVRESARSVRADDGRVLYYDGIVEDITTRRHAEEGMRQLSGRLLRLQDEERRRIARELHETTAQGLAALVVNLTVVKTSAADLSPRASACLSESLELADQCSREIRTISYLLHPPLVDEAGLGPALRWYTAGFARRSGIEVHVDVSPEFGRLPSEVELTLYRIVQEALTNIHRHSGSKTARICLQRRPNEIALTVADEGHGFPSAGLEVAGPGSANIGVGIPGMQERARQHGGRLHIQSGSRGTTLTAILPLG